MSAHPLAECRGLRASWRRWSPWVLRDRLERIQADIHRHDTATEQSWRFIAFTLRGHPQPWEAMRRYTVKGGTLFINAADDPTWPR